MSALYRITVSFLAEAEDMDGAKLRYKEISDAVEAGDFGDLPIEEVTIVMALTPDEHKNAVQGALNKLVDKWRTGEKL